MFQDEVSGRIHLPYSISHSLENIDTGLVEIGTISGCIGKSFGEIKSKAVDFILSQPVGIDPIHKYLGCDAFMIEIIPPGKDRIGTGLTKLSASRSSPSKVLSVSVSGS